MADSHIIDDILNSKNSSKIEEEIIKEDILLDEYEDNDNDKNNKIGKIDADNEKTSTKKLESEIYSNGINSENISENVINNSNGSKDLTNKNKKELINDLIEKENLLELLIKSNNELKSKIEYSNKKFEEIINKVESQKNEKNDINDQIKQIEKEIKECKSENSKYKKMVNQLLSKIEIKDNIEKDSNIKVFLKQEKDKNKELKNKLFSIKNINMAQLKYINDYDKENHISENIEIFKKEIEQEKNSIKEYQEKFLKLERFNKAIHEKILSIELIVKKIKDKKSIKEIKCFSENELHDTIDVISNLRSQIDEKRNELNHLCKNNDDKIYKLLSENKKIELEINDNLRINKLLIFQRNELRRIIKNLINK